MSKSAAERARAAESSTRLRHFIDLSHSPRTEEGIEVTVPNTAPQARFECLYSDAGGNIYGKIRGDKNLQWMSRAEARKYKVKLPMMEIKKISL